MYGRKTARDLTMIKMINRLFVLILLGLVRLNGQISNNSSTTAIILYDRTKALSCVAAFNDTSCPHTGPADFRIANVLRLKVSGRKLLSQHTLYLGPTTGTNAPAPAPFVGGGTIALLSTGIPPSNGAEPKASIASQTSAHYLDLLIDPTTAAVPQTELALQLDELKDQGKMLIADNEAFKKDYSSIVGEPGTPVNCGGGPDPNTALVIDKCLDLESKALPGLDWGLASRETVFGEHVRTFQELVSRVHLFSQEFEVHTLRARATDLQDRMKLHELEQSALLSNIDSAEDAIELLDRFYGPKPEVQLQVRAQLKAHLLKTLGSAPGQPMLIPDIELNSQVESYELMLRDNRSLVSRKRYELEHWIKSQLKLSVPQFNSELEENRLRLTREIPSVTSSINQLLAKCASLINEIYRQSSGPDSQTDYALDIGQNRKTITYAVAEIERFRLYSLASSSDSSHEQESRTAESIVARGAFTIEAESKKGLLRRLLESL
jgi:hypothetical protein